MPSSTSDSDRARRFTRAAWLLLGGCVVVALGLETIARVGFDHVSKIQRRMADEYRQAIAIGRDDRSGHRHLLFVGNSLLDEDVRFDDVRTALGTDWDARRYVVEQTYYRDWYYGLRRLFREGAHPDVVIVMLSVMQWIRPDIRGDYSARYLMSFADLPAASRELELNATQTANLFLSNGSQFWGARAEMRNYVLKHIMPDLAPLMDFSSYVDDHHYGDDEVAGWARPRLARMKTLVDANGARLVVMLPAVLDPQDAAGGVFSAAHDVGIAVVRPVPSGTFGPNLYRDAGFHLNPAGAALFTTQAIPVLRQELTAPARVARAE